MPHNITLLPLPPYAPELNAMENVWDYLRANKLSSLVWDSRGGSGNSDSTIGGFPA